MTLILKWTPQPKIKNTYFPFTCSAIYVFEMFWCGLTGFEDTRCQGLHIKGPKRNDTLRQTGSTTKKRALIVSSEQKSNNLKNLTASNRTVGNKKGKRRIYETVIQKWRTYSQTQERRPLGTQVSRKRKKSQDTGYKIKQEITWHQSTCDAA